MSTLKLTLCHIDTSCNWKKKFLLYVALHISLRAYVWQSLAGLNSVGDGIFLPFWELFAPPLSLIPAGYVQLFRIRIAPDECGALWKSFIIKTQLISFPNFIKLRHIALEFLWRGWVYQTSTPILPLRSYIFAEKPVPNYFIQSKPKNAFLHQDSSLPCSPSFSSCSSQTHPARGRHSHSCWFHILPAECGIHNNGAGKFCGRTTAAVYELHTRRRSLYVLFPCLDPKHTNKRFSPPRFFMTENFYLSF